MRSDITMEGPAYIGKKSNRSAVFETADEEKLPEPAVTEEDEHEDEDDDDDLHLVLHMTTLSSFVNIVLL